MKPLFDRLFGRKSAEDATVTDNLAGQPAAVDRLALENELQGLRLALNEREERIRHLQQENERLRQRQAQVVEETVRAQLEGLFGDLAGPASQILTQADLLEAQGKPVQARDVLPVARRMVRAIERHGVVFDGAPGSSTAFDPEQHTPINSGVTPAAGQPVTVRFAGARYQGKLIYKSVVE